MTAAVQNRTGQPAAGGFVPSPRQVAYLGKLFEALSTGAKATDEVIAEALDCRRQTISEWRRNPAFLAWVATELRAQVGARWSMVLATAFRFALEGSIEHMKFLKTVFEPDDVPPPPAIGAGPQIIFNIPRPQRELEGQIVVVDALRATEAHHA
jgi:hypothetical protein